MNAQTKVEVGPPAVYTAINAVMAHMAKEGISKTRKNAQQGYSFRGIDDVYNALASVLAANRLVMLPFVRDMLREERQTKSGGALNYTILTVDFDLVSADDGSKHTVRTVGEAMDSADKSSNKAQSAALKYAAMEVFMIPTEGDNDADASTPELAPQGRVGRDKPEDRTASSTGPANQAQGMPDAEFARLVQLIEATSTDRSKMLKHFGVKDLRFLSQAQYGEAVEKLTADLAAMAKKETNTQASGLAEVLEDEIPY